MLLGADTTNAQALIDEGDAVGPLTKYATNLLTVIVPANNPKGIQTPADLAKPGVCVIGAGANVPITKYATQLVANLSARPEYGADFATKYAANVCSLEDNVGAVVNKVSLGEGDAAIVYVTDAEVQARTWPRSMCARMPTCSRPTAVRRSRRRQTRRQRPTS